MSVISLILKPAPHCPIPYGHPCYRGYTPAEDTNIRRTWKRSPEFEILDDYDYTDRLGYLENVGGWK